MRRFWDYQNQILRWGNVVWAACIQANNNLYTPGTTVRGAEYIASHDPYFESRPDELLVIAEGIFALKGTLPKDFELRIVAERITDELYRSLGDSIPHQLTDGRDVRRYSTWVNRKHLPHRCLSYSIVPFLLKQDTPFGTILPHRYWSPGILAKWKLSEEQEAALRRRKQNQNLISVSGAAISAIWTYYKQHDADTSEVFVRVRIDHDVTLVFTDERNEDDHVVTISGLTFVVDSETAAQNSGARIDFDAQRQGFRIDE